MIFLYVRIFTPIFDFHFCDVCVCGGGGGGREGRWWWLGGGGRGLKLERSRPHTCKSVLYLLLYLGDIYKGTMLHVLLIRAS